MLMDELGWRGDLNSNHNSSQDRIDCPEEYIQVSQEYLCQRPPRRGFRSRCLTPPCSMARSPAHKDRLPGIHANLLGSLSPISPPSRGLLHPTKTERENHI